MADNSFPGPDTIHRFELNNGLTVLIYENDASQSIVVDGVVRAGALAESLDTAGLASYTADMLLRGTTSRSFDEIYESIESIGSSVSFGADRHATDLGATGLAEDLELILGVLADSLRHPVFPGDQVEKVRGEITAGLQMRANDTRQMAGLKFRELLYQEHPYGRSVDGYLDSIRNFSRDDIVEFHEKYYGPKGMILTLVGAVKAEHALAKVESAFGDWNTGQEPVPSVSEVARPGSRVRVHHEMPDKSQTDIVLGVPGPPRSAPGPCRGRRGSCRTSDRRRPAPAGERGGRDRRGGSRGG